jgi:hypothetical protein
MVRNAFFLSQGQFSDHRVLAVIIGENLTEDTLLDIWDEAYPRFAEMSRQYHKNKETGPYMYDWQIFLQMCYQRGFEVIRLPSDRHDRCLPEIPRGTEFNLI